MIMGTRGCLLGIGFVCSATALAGSVGPIASVKPYDGFYVAGDIGVANLIDKESTLYLPGQYDNHQFSSTGFVGGGMVG